MLGLSLERIIEDLQIYQLRCGRSIVDLRVLPADKTLADKDVRGVDHVCLMLHGDFDAVVDYLEANAVPIVMGPVELYGATGYGSSVYVTDPDGHTLELKADHAQYPIRTTARQAMGSVTRPLLHVAATALACPFPTPLSSCRTSDTSFRWRSG